MPQIATHGAGGGKTPSDTNGAQCLGDGQHFATTLPPRLPESGRRKSCAFQWLQQCERNAVHPYPRQKEPALPLCRYHAQLGHGEDHFSVTDSIMK